MTPSSSNLIFPVGGLITGIIISKYCPDPIISGYFFSAAFLVYLFFSLFIKDPVYKYRFNKIHTIWIFLVFGGVGILDGYLAQSKISDSLIKNSIYADGTVTSISSTTGGDKCVIVIDNLFDSELKSHSTEHFPIILKTETFDYVCGDRIRFRFKPITITDNPNYFNTRYASHLANKGIKYISTVDSEEIFFLEHQTTLSSIAANIRSTLESKIENCGLSTPTNHFLITILLGDRSYLDNDNRNSFADGGISHIIALSGMHVGILAGILLWILLPFNLIGRYKLRIIITTIGLFIYAFITGFNPSTVRAVLMVAAVTITIVSERKNNAWNSLLFASFFILLLNPDSLFDIGFQLSFLCVMALIFFGNTFNPINHKKHPILYKVSSLFICSIVATVATWCISAYYFEIIPSMFLILNVITVPLLPLFIFLALIYIGLSSIGCNIELLAKILDIAYNGLIELINWLTLNGSTSIHFKPSLISVFIWTLILLMLAYLCNGYKPKILKYASCCTFIIFIICLIYPGNMTAKGIIVQDYSSNISILFKNKKSEQLFKAASKSICEIKDDSNNLLIIDQPDLDINKIGRKKYNAIILASGITMEDIYRVVPYLETDVYILHSSIRKKKEYKIQQYLDSLGLQYHSLRNDGPWRIIYN